MDKMAIVTGAGHRLGKELTLTLSRKGYSVLLHYYKSKDQAQELVNLIRSEGGNVYPFKADLTNQEHIEDMWKFIRSLSLDLEVLVNSAAIMKKKEIQYITFSDFDETIALNLRAPFFCSQEASKTMVEGGLIINISDTGAGKNWIGYPIYSISKSSLEVMTRLMAKAYAPKIRVNAIAPGLILPPETGDEKIWMKLEEKIPLKRKATVREITSMVEYLISNKYITGQIFGIDGGYSLI